MLAMQNAGDFLRGILDIMPVKFCHIGARMTWTGTNRVKAYPTKRNACLLALAFIAATQAVAQSSHSFRVQAEQGHSLYAHSCARCHGAHLSDGEFGPPLHGDSFLSHWAGRSASELFGYIKGSMPPGEGGMLDDASYLQLTAYLLSRNGLASAAKPLTSDSSSLAAMSFPGRRSSKFDPRTADSQLAAGVMLPAWPRAPDPLAHFSPVSEASLQHPPPGDWLTWRRSYDDAGFSPLDQINKRNVRELRLAWSLALPAGANEATPLAHDGVLFVHGPDDSLMALDASTGALLWLYRYASHSQPSSFPAMVRSIALYGDKLFMTTLDTHVVAINAVTGALVWDHAVANPSVWAVSGGPLVARGKVMQGVTGRGPGGAFIVGLDAATGHELWRFHSIAQPGDPNAKTWNETPLARRTGGSIWTAGSFDPDLGVAYFGIAQTYDTATLLHPVSKPGVSNAGLYLDSTVALDPDTGALRWYYQHLPNDQWDFDFAFERQIIELPVGGGTRKIVVTPGKPAIYDALTADSGDYLFSIDLGLQNLVTAIDPKTGAKTIDVRRYPGHGTVSGICPHSAGAKSWIPGAYNPQSMTIFVPLVESCMDLVPTGPGEQAPLSSGYRFALRPRPDTDGRYGRIEAVDLTTRKSLWKVRQRAPQTSGVLATAGGLVFAGALDRAFTAYDDATGEALWKAILSDVPSAAPITYLANGRQYVAMIVGYGSPQSSTFTALTPEITLPLGRSSAIWVFELPHGP
jgi:alcohol dehydrogenase (cytochrome c)